MATVALLGTCDTKLQELLFLRDEIQQYENTRVIFIDVGRTETHHAAISMTVSELASRYGDDGDDDGSQLQRGELIKLKSKLASRAAEKLYKQGEIHGIIAAGGSGGTSLAAAAMRDALPIGFPKFIVSTIASGDTGPIVGETDITLMHSVVDVAGLNQLLRDILSNAGSAIAAAAASYARREKLKRQDHQAMNKKKRVGITMFGVTTPGVDAVRRHLEANYPIETFVFHATGHGGTAMERLVRQGDLDAVLDLTTTEICDFIVGGNMSAGPDRLDAAVEAGIPNIISLGALDMANFGPMARVPPKHQGQGQGRRLLYEHNPVVTLMRTSQEECRQIAGFICDKLKKTRNPSAIEMWLPVGGVSAMAKPGGPFADDAADQVLFDALREGMRDTEVKLVEDSRDINDPEFGVDIADALARKMGLVRSTS